MLLVLSNKGKGMQSSSGQPLVGRRRCVTTLITATMETIGVLTIYTEKQEILVGKSNGTYHSIWNVLEIMGHWLNQCTCSVTFELSN